MDKMKIGWPLKVAGIWILVAVIASYVAAFFSTTLECLPVHLFKPYWFWLESMMGILVYAPIGAIIGVCLGLFQVRLGHAGESQIIRTSIVVSSTCALIVLAYAIMSLQASRPDNCAI